MILATALAVAAFGMGVASAQTDADPVRSETAEPYVAPAPVPGVAIGVVTRDPYPEGLLDPDEPIPPHSPVSDGISQIAEDSIFVAPPDALSSPLINVAGVTPVAFPPDTVHDVGPNHIVQMTNGTGFIVFDKQGNPIGGATPNAAIRSIAALWPAGDVCAQFDTDPIVVYDHLADRWLMAQVIRDPGAPGGGNFNPPGPALCIAVSTTPDPTGTWYAYTYDDVALGFIFPDYEKIGVWPDGYYMSSYEGGNLGLFVFNRANMLVGAGSFFFKFTISSLTPNAGVRNTRILPSDLDGPEPPVGTPNYFVRTVDSQQDTSNPVDRIEIFTFDVDWINGIAILSKLPDLVPAPFQVMVCDRNGDGGRDCVPQPNGGSVDALSNRPMMQLKYRNFGAYESMVFNQTIDVSGSVFGSLGFVPANEVAGIRWYELRNTGAGWFIQNQGTYAPQPATVTDEAGLIHRWMGSIAMDKFGSLALGYNVVNADPANPINPGISYAGRRYDDLANTLPQIEQSILVGAASQNGLSNRWGDYSAMTVDPVDDCTFWFTAHVADTDGVSAGKPTQIASFAFNECAADLSIEKFDFPDPVNAGEQLTYSFLVRNNGDIGATNVVVIDTLPPGVSFVSDSLPGPECDVAALPVITCNLGDIAVGEFVQFTITVAVDSDLLFVPDAPIEIENVATVSADQNDTDESNNSTAEVTLVNDLADLAVSKICKPDEPAEAGTIAHCDILVDNLGPSGARNVTLIDEIVSNGDYEVIGFTGTNPGACVGLGVNTDVTCDIGDLDAGERWTLRVEFTTNDAVDINDQVTVSSDTPDPDTSNNSASGSVTFVGVADLSIAKTENVDPVIAGTNLTYTLSVSNAGPSTAKGVVVTDQIPAGTQMVSAIVTTGGNCNIGVAGDPLQPTICNLGNLAPASGGTIEIEVYVLPDTTGVIHNDAEVTADSLDDDNSNNRVTEDTTIEVVTSLTVAKYDDKDPVAAGDELTYLIDLENGGPSTATNVVLTDYLPPETSLIRYKVLKGNPNDCVQSSSDPDIVICELGSLAPGGLLRLTIDVLVDPSTAPGTLLTNSVVVTEDSGLGASVDETTLVETFADLWVDKTGGFITQNPGKNIRYTITVHNDAGCSGDDPQVCGDGGPSDAQNVVMVDTLPVTAKKLVVTFVSEDCTYDDTSHTVTCITPTLAAGDFVVHEIEATPRGRLRLIRNNVAVSSDTDDPNGANNADYFDLVVGGGGQKGTGE